MQYRSLGGFWFSVTLYEPHSEVIRGAGRVQLMIKMYKNHTLYEPRSEVILGAGRVQLMIKLHWATFYVAIGRFMKGYRYFILPPHSKCSCIMINVLCFKCRPHNSSGAKKHMYLL